MTDASSDLWVTASASVAVVAALVVLVFALRRRSEEQAAPAEPPLLEKRAPVPVTVAATPTGRAPTPTLSPGAAPPSLAEAFDPEPEGTFVGRLADVLPEGLPAAAPTSSPAASGPVSSGPLHDRHPADDEEISIDADSLPLEANVVPLLADLSAQDDEPTRSAKLVLVSGSGTTDRGKKRKANEDALHVDDDHGLFVVADGMGGHRGGARASALAVDVVARHIAEGEARPYVTVPWKPAGPDFGELATVPLEGDLPKRAARVASAVSEANDAILLEANADPNFAGMGTTLVVAQFEVRKQRLYLGHVGDSRCYRFRAGDLAQVTRDHTMEGEFGIRGAHGHRLARAVGIAPAVKIDMIVDRPLPGDIYLICSDGLTKTVPTARIGDILASFEDPEVAARELIAQANSNGGIDNVTAVVVRVAAP